MKKVISKKKSRSRDIHFTEETHPKFVKEGAFRIDDDVWSTQKRIAKLFGRSVPTINDHIFNILKDKEINEDDSVLEIMISQTEGKKTVTRKTLVYNTDMLISVGFRTGGEWGKEFRKWAREIVRKSYN